MTREEELDAMEYSKLSQLFISELKNIVEKGAKRGLTEEQTLAEYPDVVKAMDEIKRISTCPIEELQECNA